MKLSGSIHVGQSLDQLYDDLAQVFMGAAGLAIYQRGVFHVALSGGTTPEPFYIRLVTDPRFRAIPWEKTHIWMVDERRVPENDPRSNFRMIREALVDHVTISRRQVHPMPVMEEDPAMLYEAQLAEAFDLPAPVTFAPGISGKASPSAAAPGDAGHDPSVPQLDFVLLGMGDDAHTASLFPGSRAVSESRRWIAVNDGPSVTPPPRVTMTYPLLNASRRVAVLVTGAKKAETLRRVERQLQSAGPDAMTMPITGIQPTGHNVLTWFMDQAAAGA